MQSYSSLKEDIDTLIVNITKRVTSMNVDGDFDYACEREKLMANNLTKQLVPSFIKSCRNLDAIWAFIQPKFPKYYQRREFINKEFEPMINYIESLQFENRQADIAKILKVGEEFTYIQEYWDKSKARIESDPEGAITVARSLLETSLKYILDSLEVEYKDNGDLNLLYRTARKELNLAPDQHNEDDFVKVLSGCASVVGGLSGIRNDFGDSHGKKIKHYKASPRHARLVVNLAGAMSEFLIDTYLSKFMKRDDGNVTI